ncbi:GIY-YIG nuclease family protein [Streptomyces sp. CRCS-T-1]|uniref:GIY-YIG nuclease family protein n=1 Tax=Streptomyces TaxID=1883 RepID=UPI00351FFA96
MMAAGGTGAEVRDENALLEAPALAVDGSVPYWPSQCLAVPRRGGVYVIHDMRGSLYIGRSDCLYDRFHAHYEYSHNQRLRRALRRPAGCIHFSWVLAHGEHQKALEQRLIRDLHPLCNHIRYTTTKEGSS